MPRHADVVEGAPDQLRREAFAGVGLGDLGMHENDTAATDAVFHERHDLSVDEELVALTLAVVAHLPHDVACSRSDAVKSPIPFRN